MPDSSLDHNGCANGHVISHGCIDAEVVAEEEEREVSPTAFQGSQMVVEEEGENVQHWKVTALHFSQQIHQVLGPGTANEEQCNEFHISLKCCDFWTLNAGKWLNDQVK